MCCILISSDNTHVNQYNILTYLLTLKFYNFDFKLNIVFIILNDIATWYQPIYSLFFINSFQETKSILTLRIHAGDNFYNVSFKLYLTIAKQGTEKCF